MRCRNTKGLALVVTAAMAMTNASIAAQASGASLVGIWAPDPHHCTPVDGMVSIGPKSMTGDELHCDFRTVNRAGDTVTWKGMCGTPVPTKSTVVKGTLTNGLLALEFDGESAGPYRRCQ